MRHFSCAKYSPSTGGSILDYVECFDQTLITTFPSGLPPGTVNHTFATKVLEDCAAPSNYDWTEIHSCATSSAGDALVAKDKAETPAHKGVPFVTIDSGAVIYNSADLNLITEVCKAYTGTKPAACSTAAVVTVEDQSEPPSAYTGLTALA